MNKEDPIISLSYREEENYYVLCVSDNGPGIAEDKMKWIFGLFKTAHDGNDQVESHGIGLSIVKQLVEENGGKIWVESNPGEGSRFLFTIKK
jgi:signal transduction histidine kinase